MGEEGLILFSLLGMPVTAYAVCLVISLTIGLAALHRSCARRRLAGDTAGMIAVLALPLGLLGARLFYCVARWSLYEEIGFLQMLRLWDGGYALWGAMAGGALAGVLTAKRTHQPTSRVLDAMAAPAALVICFSRFSEYFSGQGNGLTVEHEALCFFPVAVFNTDYEEWHYAVFMLEAVVALVIFAALLRKHDRPQGDTARLFVLLYSVCQVLCESLRRDEFLRWLFVRVSQLTAAIVLGFLIFFAILRWKQRPVAQRHLTSRKIALLCFVFLACIGVCIWMEFAVDKSPDLPVWACYSIMAVSCAGMGAAAYQIVLKN
ncbi:MAG: prolipoprotein diacylglyceryl transferase [Clostridia bacterium]|nr:prolipoprotein diacylglyceryl transferase [Clostridia bacterium]